MSSSQRRKTGSYNLTPISNSMTALTIRFREYKFSNLVILILPRVKKYFCIWKPNCCLLFFIENLNIFSTVILRSMEMIFFLLNFLMYLCLMFFQRSSSLDRARKRN